MLALLAPRANQGVRTNPSSVRVLGRKHRNQIERCVPRVDERVRHSCRHFCNVRRLHRKRLVPDPVLSSACEQDMCLFCVMHMKSGSTTWVSFSNNEGQRLESVFITRKTVRELARQTVVVIKLIKIEKERVWVVWFLRWAGELLIRQLILCSLRELAAELLRCRISLENDQS